MRIGLQKINEPPSNKRKPKSKYDVPRTKKQQRMYEKNRKNTAKQFCQYGSLKLPKPISSRKLSKDVCVNKFLIFNMFN